MKYYCQEEPITVYNQLNEKTISSNIYLRQIVLFDHWSVIFATIGQHLFQIKTEKIKISQYLHCNSKELNVEYRISRSCKTSKRSTEFWFMKVFRKNIQ